MSRPLCPLERDPVPIAQEPGWASQSVGTGTENLAPTRIRFPDLPARSKSLYEYAIPPLLNNSVAALKGSLGSII